jgi:serine/threonine-protein kinase
MPWYVENEEVVVPNVVGIQKEDAGKIVEESNLSVVFDGPKFNDQIPKDHIVYQKPDAGEIVKSGRRVYLYYSGGNYKIKMPLLKGKTLRDVKSNLKRLGLKLNKITKVKSEYKTDIIIEQFPEADKEIPKGSNVDIKISVGPNIGMVRVPDLLGQSYTEAEQTLRSNSLVVGKVEYQKSPNLLPNTVIAQFPSKNKLVNVGSAVDVFITKSE